MKNSLLPSAPDRAHTTRNTYKYYEVIATIDGEEDVLFGSYDREDCIGEKISEGHQWRNEGYRKISIRTKIVSEAPDPTVYA